jgi:predicted transcriptional regulator
MAHLRAADDAQTVSDIARAVPGTQDWHRHRETVRRSCHRLRRDGHVQMQRDPERGPYEGLSAWVVWASSGASTRTPLEAA